MTALSYTIKGDPTPLARARVNFKTRRIYDAQVHTKLVVILQIREQHGSQPMLTGPLSLAITFFMPMPSSWSQKKKDSMAGKFHWIKPDTTNMTKFVEDCCNGITYHDDAAIAMLERVVKIYDFEPRTEFTLSQLK